ncbi:M43 family zinc metalloprotease [Hymenobacter bucti]|uniref:M43 family zinc metalloprotease n=1 Tax=Hymenobacter bucti TaxID=1844114 RepID=A0ABW4QR81_9BACT
MTKLYSLLAGCWLAVLALGARPAAGQTLPSPGPRTCATDQANALQQVQLQKRLPGYKPTVATQTRTTAALRTTAVTYTLPVIVHVINDGEAVGVGTNISQAQVQSQLDVLNEDYRNLNPDGSLVPSPFQPLRGDMQVQFVPAALDPSGNPLAEPGIDRVNRTTKGWTAPPYAANGSLAYIEGTIKPGSSWDPDRYLNIWVINLGGGLLGYAQFPDNTAGLGGLSGLGGSAATDGVVILYAAFGRVGTLAAPYNKGRTLTHELGHWFGLRHIWGDDERLSNTCSGSDYADDTPNQAIQNFGCPTYPHVSCANDPSGDMFMDYMDYVDDACMQMFSAAQKDRLQAVMAAGTPRRSILATSTVACPNGVAAATAANSGTVCPGSTVTLAATGPAGATYAWTGPNNYTSTQQNPVLANITTAMAGVYTVRVSVTTGACPGTASTTVTLSPAPPIPALATTATSLCPGTVATLSATNLVASTLPNENFNGTAPGWTIANAGEASAAWQYRTAYSYSSTYFTLSNYSLDGTRFALANSDAGGQGSITNTTLTSPAFSTQGYADLQLTFLQRFIYLTGDVAVVEASTDGTTWTAVASYAADQGTATRPATSTVNLSAFLNKPRVQVRWRYNTSWSYFWAIDNVQFSGSQPTPLYAWSVVSGDGLPATTTTPTVTVAPTQTSVYRLTVSYPGVACTSSATISVIVSLPTWNGTAGNGNWFDAGNWTGCVPTRSLDTTIPAGLTTPYPTISSGTAEVRSLTQQGLLTMTGGELALYGDYAGTGPLAASGGTIATRSTGPQSLRAAPYATLLVGGTGTKTIGAATINTALNLAGALLNTGAATVTLAPAATITETDASYVLGKVQITRTLGTTTDDFGGLGTSITSAVAPGTTTVVRTTGQPQGSGTNLGISRYYDITAAASSSLQGATLVQRYLPHELGSVAESQLVMFRSADAGATWSNEGATQRDAGAHLVSRNFVTNLQGRWTLGSATAALTPAAIQYTISALPVPFTGEGLSLLVTTPTAGPLHVRMYDVIGRTIYDHAVANVEVGTSTVQLPNSGILQPGKYILHVQQANQEVRLNVARGQ